MKFLQQLSGLVLGAQVARVANVLPAPQSINWSRSNQGLYISGKVAFNAPDIQPLQEAWVRTEKNIWSNQFYVPSDYVADDKSAVIDAVTVNIDDTAADLQFAVDESYSIKSQNSEIVINAATPWGALHALTTIEQLVVTDLEGQPFIEGHFRVNDEPLYPHRALMIDTSRNFYSVDSLLRQIDALAFSKMNVLHWHITDHQSWPLFIKSHPKMTNDAYSPREVYTIDDVRTIVQYGISRGVRIIPEIDMPGHSVAGWRQIDPELVVCENYPWQKTAVEPTPGQLDILSDKTYEVLAEVYNDISELFPDNFFHVGFDELNIGCYNTSQKYLDFISSGKSYADLAQYWFDRAVPVFGQVPDRRLVMWQEAVLSPDIPAKHIPKNTVLQAWRDGVGAVKELTAQGYDVIVASADFWYLDCGVGGDWVMNDYNVDVQHDPSPGTFTYNYGGSGGSWCAPYKSWQRIYSFNFEQELTKQERSHVLGGSVQLWSEQSDGLIADGMVWPRAAAAGELLWSGNKNRRGELRTVELGPRLLQFRERLLVKGVGASPIAPKYCVRNPSKCEYVKN